MALALVNDGPVTLVLDTAPSGTVSERAESEPA